MIHTIFINGVDIYKQYGAFLDAQGISALLTPPAQKDRLQYNSRLQHGKQVDTTHNRLADRDLTLTLTITARDEAQFLDRYAAFCELLKAGTLNISTNIYSDVVYKCNYLSCSQFSQFNFGIAKFTLKVNEANPADRDIDKDVMFFCASDDAIEENKGLIKSLHGFEVRDTEEYLAHIFEVRDTEEYSAFNNVISESNAMYCRDNFELTFTLAKPHYVEIAIKVEDDSKTMGNVCIDGVSYESTDEEDVEGSEHNKVLYFRRELAAGTHKITRPANNPAMYMIYLNIEK